MQYLSDEELAGVDLVAYENGFISQRYTDNKGKTHLLAYVKDGDTFVYLRPEVYSKYLTNTALGLPVGERIQVAETSAQTIYAYPFTNGYIRLTVSEQETIVGGEVVVITNEAAAITVGAIYDAENNFFETVSYADSLTESIVNASVANAYDFLNIPDNATLAAAFKAAYEAAFEKGFSAANPPLRVSPGGRPAIPASSN